MLGYGGFENVGLKIPLSYLSFFASPSTLAT